MRGIINEEKFKALLKDGMSIMVGGFLTNGTPEGLVEVILIKALVNLLLINK